MLGFSFLHYFRNAEIKQFDFTVISHEDVARLDVTMNYEILMRVTHYRADYAKKFKPFR